MREPSRPPQNHRQRQASTPDAPGAKPHIRGATCSRERTQASRRRTSTCKSGSMAPNVPAVCDVPRASQARSASYERRHVSALHALIEDHMIYADQAARQRRAAQTDLLCGVCCGDRRFRAAPINVAAPAAVRPPVRPTPSTTLSQLSDSKLTRKHTTGGAGWQH
jgi:hypothetical protein